MRFLRRPAVYRDVNKCLYQMVAVKLVDTHIDAYNHVIADTGLDTHVHTKI